MRISPPQSALGLRLPTCRPTGLAGSFGWSLIMPCGRIANKRTAPTWQCIDADLARCGSGSRSALVAEGSPPPKGCCWAASWPLATFASGGGCRRQLRPRKDRTRHAAKNMLHAPCCLPRLPGSTWSRHGCRRAARAARQCRSCVRSCGQRGGARSSPGGPPPWRAPSLQTRGSSLGSSSPPDSWAHQARAREAGGTGSGK